MGSWLPGLPQAQSLTGCSFLHTANWSREGLKNEATVDHNQHSRLEVAWNWFGWSPLQTKTGLASPPCKLKLVWLVPLQTKTLKRNSKDTHTREFWNKMGTNKSKYNWLDLFWHKCSQKWSTWTYHIPPWPHQTVSTQVAQEFIKSYQRDLDAFECHHMMQYRKLVRWSPFRGRKVLFTKLR